ncbi:hypothetical protein IQ07DRAFT_77821 [Pyrenochaeta sp. DS3sAY3a]|nr:hypothetical protein IQ07DRAFT_77821 [Pyrenochaeta sp. DS3sAY3a]
MQGVITLVCSSSMCSSILPLLDSARQRSSETKSEKEIYPTFQPSKTIPKGFSNLSNDEVASLVLLTRHLTFVLRYPCMQVCAVHTRVD